MGLLAVGIDFALAALEVTPLGTSSSTGLAVLVVVARGGALAIRGSTVDITVLAPGLSAPLVVVGVVPLVVGLGGVRLGVGAAIGFLNGEVLISAISIEVRGRSLLGLLAVALGGTLLREARLLSDGDNRLGLVVALMTVTWVSANGSDEESESESFHVGWRMFKLYNLSLLGLLNDAEPLF